MEHRQLLMLAAAYLASATFGQECTFQFHVPYNRDNFQCGSQHDLRLTNDLARVQSQLELEGSRNIAMMETFKDKITSLDSDVQNTTKMLTQAVKDIAVVQGDIEGIKGVENVVDALEWMLMNLSQSLPQQILNLEAKMLDIVKNFQEENKRQAVRFTTLENRMEKVNKTMEKVFAETTKQSNTVKELSGQVAAVIGTIHEAPPAPERVQRLETDLAALQTSYQVSSQTLQTQMENLMLQVKTLQTSIDHLSGRV